LNGDPTAAALAGELIAMVALVAGVEGEFVAGVDGAGLDGAEGDGVEVVGEAGEVVDAAVGLEAAPPHPAATSANTTSKESARALCFKKVTSYPFRGVFSGVSPFHRSRAATSICGNRLRIARIYSISGESAAA
jgi:hypothetical protein